ncbi:MAG: tyrosine-type recombinase/integrase [Acidobacteria bacterium]|nr:tyrosine-type recombinase/integrase [Acidobacteriota bacterium]
MGQLRKRGGVWWIRYYRNGRRYEESAKTDKKGKAETLLRLREGDIAKGLPITPALARVTFDEAAQTVLDDYRQNGRKSLAHVAWRLTKYLTPFFGGRRLTTITTPLVRTYISQRLDAGAAPASVNRELALLKRTFTLAVRDGRVLMRPHIPMLAEANARTGFFEKAAFEAVHDALPAYLQPVATFAYLTGWRVPSEILTLQWSQVDLTAGIVRLEPGSTKSGEGRVFPFAAHPDLTTLLETLDTARGARQKATGAIVPWVFHRHGKPIKSAKKAWATACETAGCPGRLWHDFRRTAVRNLVRAGVPEKTAMLLTGHKTRSVFDRYDIVNEADLRAAVAKLAERPLDTRGDRKGTVRPIRGARRSTRSAVSA